MSSNCGRCNKYNCSDISFFASIILGIVGAMLFFNAIITIPVAFYWAALATAVVTFLLTLYIARDVHFIDVGNCVCQRLTHLYFGLFGTILTSLVLLFITFAATSVIGAIIVGILLFFIAFSLSSVACLVLCTLRCNAA